MCRFSVPCERQRRTSTARGGAPELITELMSTGSSTGGPAGPIASDELIDYPRFPVPAVRAFRLLRQGKRQPHLAAAGRCNDYDYLDDYTRGTNTRTEQRSRGAFPLGPPTFHSTLSYMPPSRLRCYFTRGWHPPLCVNTPRILLHARRARADAHRGIRRLSRRISWTSRALVCPLVCMCINGRVLAHLILNIHYI